METGLGTLQSYYSEIDFKESYVRVKDCIQFMEECNQNYSPTVMFCGTPCSLY